MTPALKTIRLYGALGAEFGRLHRLAVGSAEAVRALCALLPGFERRMLDSGDKGVRYACFIGRRNLAEDELSLPAGQDEIRIAPMPAGAKRGGLFQVILGVAMIAASFIPGLSVAMWSGTTATWSAGLASMGRHGAERRGAAADAAAAPAQRQGRSGQRRFLQLQRPGQHHGAGQSRAGDLRRDDRGQRHDLGGIYSEDQA